MTLYRSSLTADRRRSPPGAPPEWLTEAYDRSLPIFAYRREIVETLRAHQVVIIAGETGCGKTTHLPLFCLEARGEQAGRIVVAQPRRIAAISCANYLASLLPDDRKTLIGHKVRFHENVRPETGILFATDGIILAETAGDRILNKYGTIIVDEAHERSLPIDFLLGYLRSVLLRRPELKLVIASATMDTRLFSRCFRNAPVITVSGRLYPVEIRHEPVISLWQGSALRSYIDGVIHAVRSIMGAGEHGDILAFLPTVDDIHECATGLRALLKGTDCDVFPLYGRMSADEQSALFSRSTHRRIICATNIAETSLTVPNIRFVVDTGLARCVRFDPAAGISRMPVERISKAAADQRAGRCGRVQNGICIRLYSEAEYASMPRFTQPEMRRANLAGVILRMAHLGFGKPQQFPFVQEPSAASLDAGYRQLRFLGALDSQGGLTRLGKAMAALPLDPAIARMLLHAQENGAFSELAVIASALSVGELRNEQVSPAPSGTSDKQSAAVPLMKGVASDFMELIAVWRNLPWKDHGGVSRRGLVAFCENKGFSFQRIREWINVHRQLVRICRRFGRVNYGFTASYEQVHKSLLSALAGAIAEASEDGSYATGRMRGIMISPGSKLFRTRHDWVLLHDVADTKRPYARYAAVIKAHWVQELFPRECRVTYDDPLYDPLQGSVVCLRQVRFNGLHIVRNQRMEYGLVRPREAHEMFIREALVKRAADRDYDFMENNRTVLDMVQLVHSKVRMQLRYRGEQALADRYDERLPGVFSLSQLDAMIGRAKNDRFLRIRPEDILSGPPPDTLDFPDAISVAGRQVPVSYVYEPGSATDGATAVIPLDLYRSVPVYFWEWLLPVFIKPRIRELAQRAADNNAQADFDRKVEEAVRMLSQGQGHFMSRANAALHHVFGLSGTPDELSLSVIPPHLWLRLEIIDETGKMIDECRPPLRSPTLPAVCPGLRPAMWREWCAPWEFEDISEWNSRRSFEKVCIQPPGQLAPVFGITGLAIENGRICMRVFFNKGAACQAHGQAVRLLLERDLEDAIAWAWRDFSKSVRIPFQVRELMEELEAAECLEQVFSAIVTDPGYDLPEDPEAFSRLKALALQRLRLAGQETVDIVLAVLPEYAACLNYLLERMKSDRNTAAQTEHLARCERLVEEYIEILFQPAGRIDKIKLLPRYLRGTMHRMRMAVDKPQRYGRCVQMLDEFYTEVRRLRKKDQSHLPDIARLLDEFEEMVEEYALTVFAHGQIAPRFPVSEPRLRRSLEELESAVSEKEC